MHIQKLPARNVQRWFELGWQTFWRQPLALGLLFGLNIACTLLLQFIPLVGPVLNMLLHPLLVLLLVIAASQAVAGQRIRPALLLRALDCGRAGQRKLLVLGGVHVLVWLGLLGLSALVDGGSFASASLGLGLSELWADPPAQSLSDSLLSLALLLQLVLSCHAPGLVYWHGVSPVKALRLSAAACLRNWRAVLLSGLLGIRLGLAMLLGIALLFGLIGSVTGMKKIALGGALAAWTFSIMACSAICWISQFLGFRDCFGVPATPARAEADAT